jgi:hypothetical protein
LHSVVVSGTQTFFFEIPFEILFLYFREKRRLPWIRKQELKIMEDGLIDMANDQNCSQMFAGCDKSIESLVDLKALKYWQLLAEHTPLTITI